MIDYWAEMAIDDGKVKEFLKLARQTVDVVKKEAGCLRYSWYINEDELLCHVHETWTDGEAILEHFQGPAGTEMAEQIYEICTVRRLELHGDNFSDFPPEAKKALDQLPTKYFTPIAGFIR